MPPPAITKQQALAALAAAGQASQDQDRDGLAGLSMEELAARAGVSRATLYRLFGSQQNLLQELGVEAPPMVRSRILDTTLDLLGRHGLAELSMEELAAAAGVSRATLYRLFPGKAALFAELVRRFSPFEPIAAVLETKGDRPPAEVISAVAHVMATAMEGHIGLLLQLLFEFSRSRTGSHAGADFQEDAANAMRTLPLVAGYLAEQMAAGRLRRMDPVLAVQALAGPIVMHLLMQAPAESQSGPGRGVALPLEEVIDELVGIWLRAMTPNDGEHHQRQRRTSRIRSKHHDQTDAPGAAQPHRVRPDVLPPVVSLAEAAGLDPARMQALLGTKAANLARLARAGFPVPAGVVVTSAAEADWDQTCARLLQAAAELAGRQDQRFAVRSSATSEDLAGASFAGQYETVLDVGLDQVPEAVRHVLDSAASARVSAYRQAHSQAAVADPSGSGMAVLVQVMVAADAAGVAFTANPVTGDRGEVVATAQDLEWAITDTTGADVGLWLLQARPMTALPDPVAWTPPAAGYWMRNLRLGEWLPEPMTPLFADWLLERINHGELQATREHVGGALPFPHAAINGWYYLATPPLSPRAILAALVHGRGRLVRFLRYAVLGPSRDPVAADRHLLRRLAEQWREELLPRYRRLVQAGEQQAETASPERLAGIIDQVGAMAGEQLWSLEVVGGAAWKMEGALASFYRQHLAATVDASVQHLLAGLPGAQPELPAHAVQSLDWAHPTAGELGWRPPGPSDRHRELAARREALTAQCAAVLADRPHLQARFQALLEVAQRYAIIREQQARNVTLGWPLLRRCALRLGETLHADGVIDQAEDVFFLTRAELDARAPLRDVVDRRRGIWERQRRLLAPLTIGRPPRLLARELLAAVEAVRTIGPAPEGAIIGQPASPGRATGPVRIVRRQEDFDAFQAGEVLVAQATTPAWTPLFARAVAVVTDSGTLAAHASLVAREYGIPAVVGTGDATARLHDGQVVTVDGGAGTIQPPQ